MLFGNIVLGKGGEYYGQRINFGIRMDSQLREQAGECEKVSKD